ncbi:MAG: general secretion pathway protein GspB [Geobacter sp.]|nr:general secretion pathway protein GspB [Geobacter sp.]
MSSILKALKKLEEEKIARKDEPKDIGRRILKERSASTRLPWLQVLGGIAMVAVLAVVATYAAMGGFSRPGMTKAQAVVEPTATQKSELAPPAPVPVTPQIVKVPAPIAFGGTKTTPLTVVQQAKAAANPQPAPPAPVVAEALPQPPQVSKHEQEALHPPSLRVTGIAWQKESTSRLAIVNGQAVSEGASVGGARVQTILPDRVEFAYAGQKLSVSLEK